MHVVWVHPGMLWPELNNLLLTKLAKDLGPDVVFMLGAKVLKGNADSTAFDLGVHKERTINAYIPLRGGS